ncbi:MAG: nucleotide pyrophosphohydrolase [Anaerolineae bacterium]|nr:MAG: nucleotide pyrophosphohydrolase [Anaerolineae bacterium]
MNLPDYQTKVAYFVSAYNLNAPPAARLLDLLSELGEVAKETLKASDYGKAQFQPTQQWVDELGDAFFSLLDLANQTGVNLETTLEATLSKYAARMEARGDAGSGR